MVWQLKKLEMTQSLSQAHKGDIEAHDHGLASVQGICRTSFAHVLARWLIHKRIPQRSLLTAVNNNPTAGSASDSEMQKHFDLLLRALFVCLIHFSVQTRMRTSSWQRRLYLWRRTKHWWSCGFALLIVNAARMEREFFIFFLNGDNFLIKVVFFWFDPCCASFNAKQRQRMIWRPLCLPRENYLYML